MKKRKRGVDVLSLSIVIAIAGMLLLYFAFTYLGTEAHREPTRTPPPTQTRAPTQTPTAADVVRHTGSSASITYRSITWDELTTFISDDHTNWNEYDLAQYNCEDFAVDLVAAAQQQNIKAWIVTVEFRGEKVGHAFVGFETSDHGIVYIEPQTDNPYWSLKIGEPLCDSWGMYECFPVVKSYSYVQCDHHSNCQLYYP